MRLSTVMDELFTSVKLLVAQSCILYIGIWHADRFLIEFLTLSSHNSIMPFCVFNWTSRKTLESLLPQS